jgi:hypothetical protein
MPEQHTPHTTRHQLRCLRQLPATPTSSLTQPPQGAGGPSSSPPAQRHCSLLLIVEPWHRAVPVSVVHNQLPRRKKLRHKRTNKLAYVLLLLLLMLLQPTPSLFDNQAVSVCSDNPIRPPSLTLEHQQAVDWPWGTMQQLDCCSASSTLMPQPDHTSHVLPSHTDHRKVPSARLAGLNPCTQLQTNWGTCRLPAAPAKAAPVTRHRRR